VDREAQLLRHQGLGRAGRELRPVPSKGRPVAVDGRLEWSEWEAQDGGKRSKVEVVADTVQFLGSRGDGEGGGGGGFRQTAEIKPEPVEAFTGAAASDDDIPF
jgi:single-strand DNA-binding protein